MNKVIHWIVSAAGYAVYTLAVLLFLLWYLFPSDSFRVWLQAQLNNHAPAMKWQVGDLHVGLPFNIIARDIRAGGLNTDKALFVVDEVGVRPELQKIFEFPKKLPLVYTARSLEGSVNGTFLLENEKQEVICTGQLQDMKVGSLAELWRKLGREVSGTLSGSFRYTGNTGNLYGGLLQGDLSLHNGFVELMQPILGLQRLDYNQAKTSFSFKDRIVTVTSGEVESDLFSADFNGTVTMAGNLLGSTLDVQGTFEPRPEMLANLEDPNVVRLIKSQLRNNSLSFKVTDTLFEPGIVFEGTSGVIDGIIQGGVR